MANFESVTILAFPRANSNNLWEIRVEYGATFDNDDIGKNFREGFVLFEQDDTSADDNLTQVVVGLQEFEATQPTMFRTMRHLIDGDTLDTELGAEEIYAKARLRRLDNNKLTTKDSQVLPIAP